MQNICIEDALYLSSVFQNLKIPYSGQQYLIDRVGLQSRDLTEWRQCLKEFLRKDEYVKIENIPWYEKEASDYRKRGICLSSPAAPDWPSRLSQIPDPPHWIWYRGQSPGSFDASVPLAFVGSRKAGAYARKACRELSAYAVGRGHTIISGLARGLDAFAHRCTLDYGGRTAAVLPCGLSRCYPPEHQDLLEEICESGFVLSEYPPEYPLMKHNFQSRNRIISALSDAVIIFQGSEKSGTLITARCGAEQNKEVLVLPGNIFAPEFRGSNRLIYEGADILYDLRQLDFLQQPATLADPRGFDISEKSNGDERDTAAFQDPGVNRISREELRVLKELETGSWTPEELSDETSLSVRKLRIIFDKMERCQYLQQTPEGFILTERGLSCIYYNDYNA